jgi:hypothetical protein
MTNGMVKISVRRAFLCDISKRLGLATDSAAPLLYDQQTVRAVLAGQLDGARV